MLEDALSYPTKGDDGIARNLIGGVLFLFSFLIIPAFIVMGYMVQAMAAASRGETEPPAFEDWGSLLVDGLKAILINIAYAIVPTFIMGMMIAFIGIGGSAGGDAGGLFAGFGLLGIFLAVILAFVIQYILPAALTNFGRTGKIGAAFDFDTLTPVLTSKEYIIAVLTVFLVAVAGGIVANILALVTLGLGYLLFPFFYFWLYLAGSYKFGTAYGEVTRQQGQSPGAAATPMD
ncbi:DUF4013 domain-containing protein [Haladaptatus sp. NG-SE-30]